MEARPYSGRRMTPVQPKGEDRSTSLSSSWTKGCQYGQAQFWSLGDTRSAAEIGRPHDFSSRIHSASPTFGLLTTAKDITLLSEVPTLPTAPSCRKHYPASGASSRHWLKLQSYLIHDTASIHLQYSDVRRVQNSSPTQQAMILTGWTLLTWRRQAGHVP